VSVNIQFAGFIAPGFQCIDTDILLPKTFIGAGGLVLPLTTAKGDDIPEQVFSYRVA